MFGLEFHWFVLSTCKLLILTVFGAWQIFWTNCMDDMKYIIIIIIIIILGPPAQSRSKFKCKFKDKNKLSMVAMALHSVTVMFWKETAFPFWRAMDRRWNRNAVYLLFSVIVVIRLPISRISSMAMSWNTGCLSGNRVENRVLINLVYLSILFCAAFIIIIIFFSFINFVKILK